MYTAKWRGYLYKSELVALNDLLAAQAEAGVLQTLVAIPRRRRKQVKGDVAQAQGDGNPSQTRLNHDGHIGPIHSLEPTHHLKGAGDADTYPSDRSLRWDVERNR